MMYDLGKKQLKIINFEAMKKRKEEERLFIRRFVEILAIYKEKRMRCAIT